MISRCPKSFWTILVLGCFATVFASLSVHVVMLQGFKVPFPTRSGVAPWATFINNALSVLALMLLSNRERSQLTRYSTLARWLLFAGLFAALKEVFRGAFMNAIVTSAWTFSAVKAINPLAYSLVLSGLIVAISPLMKRRWHMILGGVSVALIMSFVVRPIIGALMAPVMSSIAYLDHPDVYAFPYGSYVLFWAYLTYLEPVIACFVTAALVWPYLAERPAQRVMQFTVLILLIRGALLPTFLFSLYDPAGISSGALSESQFLLEGVVLAASVAIVWGSALRAARGS